MPTMGPHCNKYWFKGTRLRTQYPAFGQPEGKPVLFGIDEGEAPIILCKALPGGSLPSLTSRSLLHLPIFTMITPWCLWLRGTATSIRKAPQSWASQRIFIVNCPCGAECVVDLDVACIIALESGDVGISS